MIDLLNLRFMVQYYIWIEIRVTVQENKWNNNTPIDFFLFIIVLMLHLITCLTLWNHISLSLFFPSTNKMKNFSYDNWEKDIYMI